MATSTSKKLKIPTPKGNGSDAGIDPKIIAMANYLDRAIRSQNPTVGTVIAAVGILLGRKGVSYENLERLTHDITTAIRVGFYLNQASKKDK